MTTAEARQHGYTVVRGSYQTTSDDRSDRWYIEHDSDRVIDRRGGGYPTRKAALGRVGELVRGEY